MNDHTQNADAAEPPATHFSRTAVLSAMFALPVCCPPMSLLACITGGVALWQIRRNPLARGAWLAIAAMVIGAASAIVMSTLLWNNGLGLLWRGPGAPMDAVMRGDTAAMREHWSGPAGELSQPALQAFAQTLTAQHGAYQGTTDSVTRATPLKPPAGKSVAPVPITIKFERATLEADLGLELFDPKTGATVMKWRSLRVLDPVQGDLVFPPGEPAPPVLEPPAPPATNRRAPPTGDSTKPATGTTPAAPPPLR
jgi:hypothetical protein